MLTTYRKLLDGANAKHTNGAFSKKRGRILRHENRKLHGEVINVPFNPQEAQEIPFSWNKKTIPQGVVIADKYLTD
jgi:hypothetical protein